MKGHCYFAIHSRLRKDSEKTGTEVGNPFLYGVPLLRYTLVHAIFCGKPEIKPPFSTLADKKILLVWLQHLFDVHIILLQRNYESRLTAESLKSSLKAFSALNLSSGTILRASVRGLSRTCLDSCSMWRIGWDYCLIMQGATSNPSAGNS